MSATPELKREVAELQADNICDYPDYQDRQASNAVCTVEASDCDYFIPVQLSHAMEDYGLVWFEQGRGIAQEYMTGIWCIHLEPCATMIS